MYSILATTVGVHRVPTWDPEEMEMCSIGTSGRLINETIYERHEPGIDIEKVIRYSVGVIYMCPRLRYMNDEA